MSYKRDIIIKGFVSRMKAMDGLKTEEKVIAKAVEVFILSLENCLTKELNEEVFTKLAEHLQKVK